MADPKQLELLRQGVNRWNRWKEKDRVVSPAAHFHEAYVRVDYDREGSDLSEAELRAGANLRAENLREVDLSEAELRAGRTFAKGTSAWRTFAGRTSARRTGRADLS
jgi:hypothetical protein